MREEKNDFLEVILITGARAPIALEMARSFSKYPCRVIMADSLSLTIARWSNCVDQYYKIPSPRFQIQEYVAAIQQLIIEEKITHFIPTCEEAVFVASQKEKFNCKVWISDRKLIIQLHNKYTFSKFRSDLFPIPETVLIEDFKDWNNSVDYVFKPIYSRFASSVIINKNIEEDYFSKQEKNNWIAQKKIMGFEICIYSIWDNGKLKAYAAYHPLFRAGKGAGIFFEPVHHFLVLEYVKQFGKRIHYTGQLCFDVIIDENNIPYFIECNPRGTSGAHLIKNKLAACFLSDEIFIYESQQEYAVKYAMAILHPFSYLKKRNKNARDVIYRKDDKKPFFLQILSLLEITYIKFSKGTSWLEATTGDIEWNG